MHARSKITEYGYSKTDSNYLGGAPLLHIVDVQSLREGNPVRAKSLNSSFCIQDVLMGDGLIGHSFLNEVAVLLESLHVVLEHLHILLLQDLPHKLVLLGFGHLLLG